MKQYKWTLSLNITNATIFDIIHEIKQDYQNNKKNLFYLYDHFCIKHYSTKQILLPIDQKFSFVLFVCILFTKQKQDQIKKKKKDYQINQKYKLK